MSLGGIQTYITNLSIVLRNCGYNISIYQKSNEDFKVEYDGCTINGFAFEGNEKGLPRFLYEKCRPFIILDTDILIFGCETFAVKNDVPRTIGIQHGIFWDKPNRVGCSNVIYFADYVYQAYKSWLTIKRIKNIKKLVCVDYNFVNWYRALVAYPKVETTVIPNFSHIPEVNIDKNKYRTVNIIFARRFYDYRGTRIFAEAIKKVISTYTNITVTVAGEGPDEGYFHQQFDMYPQINITKYNSEDALKLHADKHIAVIPTLGSEGTSLSLLEAMASKCAVICTNVGGMTNIVIDGYNGLMINPNEGDLYQAIKRLVDDEELRSALSERAFETVENAFSHELWTKRWKTVIEECMHD